MHSSSLLRSIAVLALLACSLGSASAQFTWSTLAGNTGGVGYSDGPVAAAHFAGPGGVAFDSAGAMYIADTSNHTIRKISTSGVVTTLAGTAGRSGSADGTGSFAKFNQPVGLAVDSSGNVYVGDTGNHTIRKVTPAGVVTTFAGTAGQTGYVDATGSAARFFDPLGVAIDTSGNLYVADSSNATIRKITPTGVVSTLAGNPNVTGDTDGTGTSASFRTPCGVAVDGSGNVYVASGQRHTIRKVTAAGVVTTLAGSGGFNGSNDGTGSAARFYNPRGIAVDAAGANVYVADTSDNTIRKVTTAQGVVTTLAGIGYYNTLVSYGSLDGTGSAARFSGPNGIAMDGNGDLWVADSGNNAIRKVTTAGVVTTYAGSSRVIGSNDGTGNAAGFNYPQGVTLDSAGNTYVADTINHTIRKVTKAGVVTTIAGIAGVSGSSDGEGVAAKFYRPNSLAVYSDGTLVVADTFNHTLRLISPAGLVSTLAGTAGSAGSTDGTGSAARFNYPSGVALDGSGNIYVADTSNFTIRKVTKTGVVSTIAGKAGTYGSIDASGPSARFNQPTGIAVDTSGNIYVSDKGNNTIRKISSVGAVTTLAGNASAAAGSFDSSGMSARFNGPTGLSVDASGFVYVADSLNHTLRRVSPTGGVTTIGGKAGDGTISDGLIGAARFAFPGGIAVNAQATQAVVADSQNYRIVTGVDLATLAPSLILPATNSLLGDTIGVSYNLPEAALAGSVSLKFVGTLSTTTLYLTSSAEAFGAHSFYFSASNPFASNYVGSIDGSTVLQDDDYTVTLSYQDASGNPAASAVRTHVVVDLTPPVVTPPPDQIVNATSLAGAIVNYPAASAPADSGGPISLTYSMPSGSLFGLGVTTVNVFGTDAAGNSASASFHVTVKLNKDTMDLSLPTVTIRTPVANASVPENSSLALAGSATDNKGVLSVQVRMNNSLWLDLPVTPAAGGKSATYSIPLLALAPVPGINIIGVRSIDLWGNASAPLNRPFTYVVQRPLSMNYDAKAGKVTLLPATPLDKLQVGTTYTLTAAPNKGYLFDHWEASPTGVTHATGLRFTFVMQQGLTITPYFLLNPFAPFVGTYNGLVSPTGQLLPSVSNCGLIQITLTGAGTYSGKLTLQGNITNLTNFNGFFDPVTGLSQVGSSNAPFGFNLKLDLTGGSLQITGTVTRLGGGNVVETFSTTADLAYYSSTRKVPGLLLDTAGTGPGVYTVTLPVQVMQTGLTASQFPASTGFGTLTLQPTGNLTLVGTLPDGTAFTTGLPLSKTFTWPLYASLPNHLGLLTGMVKFDTTQADSDVSGTNLVWLRPAGVSQHYYTAGWANGILFDLVGAKFTAPTGSAVIPGLKPVDSMSGNAILTFSHGKLSADVVKNVNISTLSKVTPVSAGDTSYSVTLAPSTGMITGTFTHSDGSKPAFKGITLQKGANRGGYGFFLSTLPSGPTAQGECGEFSLIGR